MRIRRSTGNAPRCGGRPGQQPRCFAPAAQRNGKQNAPAVRRKRQSWIIVIRLDFDGKRDRRRAARFAEVVAQIRQLARQIARRFVAGLTLFGETALQNPAKLRGDGALPAAGSSSTVADMVCTALGRAKACRPASISYSTSPRLN